MAPAQLQGFKWRCELIGRRRGRSAAGRGLGRALAAAAGPGLPSPFAHNLELVLVSAHLDTDMSNPHRPLGGVKVPHNDNVGSALDGHEVGRVAGLVRPVCIIRIGNVSAGQRRCAGDELTGRIVVETDQELRNQGEVVLWKLGAGDKRRHAYLAGVEKSHGLAWLLCLEVAVMKGAFDVGVTGDFYFVFTCDGDVAGVGDELHRLVSTQGDIACVLELEEGLGLGSFCP